jgi:hypothetical protein
MVEKEYIEAKDLDDFRNEIMEKFLSLCNYNDYNKLTLLRIGETIDEIYGKYVSKPLAEVVEVVRCKDCVWFKEVAYGCYCDWHRGCYETYPNNFCKHGERRE